MMLGFHLLCMFQSTLPRGERLSGSNKRSVGICFNPRSREGSDVVSLMCCIQAFAFQSTLPRGERQICSTTMESSGSFNPRSREGSDGKTSYFHIKYSVSIHAPARGATPHLLGDFRIICVSIHAPARGATCQRKALIQSKSVSIHAPARGATLSLFHQSFPASRFNPRSREGSDYLHMLYLLELNKFQSTLPRGERPYTGIWWGNSGRRFNPRSREGSDEMPG